MEQFLDICAYNNAAGAFFLALRAFEGKNRGNFFKRKINGEIEWV
ncbi:hypothetical protein [Thiomicrorhabdus xiamenensis]|nr:hypothetical protein [Thiomicrorhabdus xiamenensis]